jgi:hypothetical protein
MVLVTYEDSIWNPICDPNWEILWTCLYCVFFIVLLRQYFYMFNNVLSTFTFAQSVNLFGYNLMMGPLFSLRGYPSVISMFTPPLQAMDNFLSVADGERNTPHQPQAKY